MIEKMNHFPINWVDGMKINKNHFIAMQNYSEDVNRDSIGLQLHHNNYGLIPNQNRTSTNISVKVDAHNKLRVTINECHAVTPNGSRIEITPDNPFNFETSYNNQNNEADQNRELVLLLKIAINPFEKEPFGERDPKENPPRIPFLTPKLDVDITEESSTQSYDSGYQVTIGRVILSNGNMVLDEHYIPPCMCTASHPKLIAVQDSIDEKFGKLELYSVQIAQKINRKQQSNQLAQMILDLADKILTFLGGNINELRWFSKEFPPAYILDKPVAMARIIKNFVDSKSGAGKEELLNYFAQWCDLSQAQFESLFISTINIGYNHLDINTTAFQIEQFLNTLTLLFSQINNLDYIGQRGDTGIFVKEQPNNSQITKSKRNRLFLED